MSVSNSLEAAALRLDSSSRAQLAYRLLDSVNATAAHDDPLTTEKWIGDAKQRVQEFLDNKVAAIDGEQVLRDARARVR